MFLGVRLVSFPFAVSFLKLRERPQARERIPLPMGRRRQLGKGLHGGKISYEKESSVGSEAEPGQGRDCKVLSGMRFHVLAVRLGLKDISCWTSAPSAASFPHLGFPTFGRRERFSCQFRIIFSCQLSFSSLLWTSQTRLKELSSRSFSEKLEI